MTLLDKQMDHLTKQALLELISEPQGRSISIYMPTERKGADTQQGPIRLKNLVGQAQAELAELGERTPDIEALLAPAQALVNNSEFWQYQSDGLALLLSADRMATYRVPLAFQETVIVNDRFSIKPLLPLVIGEGTFYLLSLRQGGVRLLRGSRFELAEVALGEEIPTSLAEVLQYDEFENNIRFHIAARPSTGSSRSAPDRGSAIYHGQGGAGDEANNKEQIIRFFRQLDNGVRDLLQGSQQPPLVLAGIDSLRGLYRQVNQYGGLIDEEITSDPEALTLPELHQRAWAIVEPIFTADRQTALDNYQHLAGTDDERAGHTIDAIVPAAYFQRIDTLFVPRTTGLWGDFDPEKNHVQVHDERQAGDQDLLDFAAVHTLLNGGRVYLVEPDELSVGTLPAAIFRY